MNNFTAFNRSYMVSVHAEVRRRFPSIRPTRDAWVIRTTFGQWEFHGPDGFYEYFRADGAFHARAKGWEAWLKKQGEED